MRVIVVGYGIQGKKRAAIAGAELVAIVDHVHPDARYKRVKDVPLADYDAALVCTPDDPKIEILEYLMTNRKHALVEKPLISDNDEDLKRLRGLSEKNRTVCYTAYNHRFEPQIMSLKTVIGNGTLGKIHSIRLFYGNGTARDVRSSVWRDQGMGIIPDLGSHMLDTVDFLLGKPVDPFRILSVQRFENKAPDYVLFGSLGRPHVLCEATMLSWRNTFHCDVIGEQGSAHIFCLCKWGPSTLTVRQRVLPSGRPSEDNETIEMKDPTWAAEYAHFKALCGNPSNNVDNDLWINKIFRELKKEAR